MKLKTNEQNVAKASAKKRAKTIRQVGPDSFQWLLAQDVAKEKRKRKVVDNWDEEPTFFIGTTSHSRINPSFLSLALKRRFLGNSTACASRSSFNVQQLVQS